MTIWIIEELMGLAFFEFYANVMESVDNTPYLGSRGLQVHCGSKDNWTKGS